MSPGVKKALLVGVANYEQTNELPTLRTPANDVSEFRRAIAHPNCGFEVDTLTDPTTNDLQKGIISLLADARSEDTLLFYYSGHGKLAQTGGLRLCARDTEERFLNANSVPVRWIKEQIDSTKAARVILVLDCCYSGLAAGAFKGDVVSAIRDAVGSGKGKFVVTSSSATELSIELAGDRNSLFTKWLVHGLDTFEADANNDDVITLDELVDYASEKVKGERSEQRPRKLGFETTGGSIEIAHRRGGTHGSLEPQAVALDWMPHAVRDIRTKHAIFFLGSGVYGSGPLSTFELINAIGREANLDVSQQNSLVTAAEYWSQIEVRRETFLEGYRGILAAQTRGCGRSAVHDFLANLEPPWLIISTTHDLLFESLLCKQQTPFTLVAHIVGPEDEGGKYVGQILVMRFGSERKVEICKSDELRVDLSKDRIIYKILGSPCLIEMATPTDSVDLASLDTAVVTEADHVAFLGDLRNKRTSIPTAFSRPFRNNSVLFLGYELHVWNYRLIARVCLRETRRGFQQEPPPLYAVRQPASSFENLFWQRLSARMLPIDVDTFIRNIT
jgi:hypothetical protein